MVEVIDRALLACHAAAGGERHAYARRRVYPRAAQAPDLRRRWSSYDPGGAVASNCVAEAERALRMARVLAPGGFPEEALPLIVKAIGIAAAAKLSALGELPVGVSTATSAQIRDLVDRGAFAPAGGGRAVGVVVTCRRTRRRRYNIAHR